VVRHGENRCPTLMPPNCVFMDTSNTMFMHLMSSVHLSAFLLSTVGSKLAELCLSTCNGLCNCSIFDFTLGGTCFLRQIPKEWHCLDENYGFPRHHSVLTSQWDCKASRVHGILAKCKLQLESYPG